MTPRIENVGLGSVRELVERNLPRRSREAVTPSSSQTPSFAEQLRDRALRTHRPNKRSDAPSPRESGQQEPTQKTSPLSPEQSPEPSENAADGTPPETAPNVDSSATSATSAFALQTNTSPAKEENGKQTAISPLLKHLSQQMSGAKKTEATGTAAVDEVAGEKLPATKMQVFFQSLSQAPPTEKQAPAASEESTEVLEETNAGAVEENNESTEMMVAVVLQLPPEKPVIEPLTLDFADESTTPSETGETAEQPDDSFSGEETKEEGGLPLAGQTLYAPYAQNPSGAVQGQTGMNAGENSTAQTESGPTSTDLAQSEMIRVADENGKAVVEWQESVVREMTAVIASETTFDGEQDLAPQGPHSLKAPAETGKGTVLSPSLNVQEPDFTQKLSAYFQQASESGKTLKIRLNPPELGTLQIEVSKLEGRTVARLEVESAAAKAVVMEQLHLLRDSLQQQGLKLEQIEVEVNEHLTEQFAGQHGRQEQSQERPQEPHTTAVDFDHIADPPSNEPGTPQNPLTAAAIHKGEIDVQI